MIKALFTGLVALSCLSYASTAHSALLSEPFSGAQGFSMIVTNDADLGNGVHVHGGGYIGGDLSLSGANSSFGSDLDASSLGLFVGGDVLGGQQIDMMNQFYFIGGTNSSTFQNVTPASQLGSNPLGLTPASIASAIDAKAAQLAALSDNGVTLNDADSNQIYFNLTAGATNVVSLATATHTFLSNSNSSLIFNNFTEDTFVVVNVDVHSDFSFMAKNQNLPAFAYSNIIWNFIGDSTITFGSSVSTFKGSIMATNSTVAWNANDIDGQLIVEDLVWAQTSQSHYYQPWQPGNPTNNVPAPVGVWFAALALLWVFRQRSGKL